MKILYRIFLSIGFLYTLMIAVMYPIIYAISTSPIMSSKSIIEISTAVCGVCLLASTIKTAINRYFWILCGISTILLWFTHIDLIMKSSGLNGLLLVYSLTILPLSIAQLIKMKIPNK